MKHHQRVTFTQGGEVLEHAVDYLQHVIGLLQNVAGGDASQRVQMLMDAYLAEQRNLLGAMERFLEDAPDKVLSTYAQYAVELPAELEGPAQPLTTLSLTQWVVALNQHLVNLFTELAESGKNDAIGEVFSALAGQVQAHERKLSKEYQRFEDL